ncbi:hypothetical protein [Comamonas aquatica]|uniref:hypothetical protein n=1 Tax=Comamonas aquatica TaxID=225991 RepID=UPI0005A6AD92|nr:hypothetical protein [Comamonas aquatica]
MTAYNPESPELQAVLAHQQLLAQATAKVQGVENAIAAQEQIAVQVAEHKNALAALQLKHQDVLADIAMGKDCTQERDALEAELFEVQNQIAQLNAQAAPEQTMLGLRRKLEQAQAELKELSSKTAGLLRQLIKAEAEAVGDEYARLAFALRDKLQRLSALSVLFQKYGAYLPLIEGVQLRIPSMALDSVKSHPHKFNDNRVLIELAMTGAEIRPFVAREADNLQAAGVELPSVDN